MNVSVVGRPNVGKSTLFNAVVGSNRALIHSTAGLTRDVNSFTVRLHDKVFKLLDTPGLVYGDSLQNQMLASTEDAVLRSALILYVVDGSQPPENEDLFWMNWIRKFSLPILLVANKLDRKAFQYYAWDYVPILSPDCVFVSAAHREGIEDLKDKILSILPEASDEKNTKKEGIRFAIIGRPNVGKSTLFNAILGKNLVLISDQPGTTRDVIEKRCKYRGGYYSIVDTPGLRRKARVETDLEKNMIKQMHKLIDHEVCLVIFMLDAVEGVTNQDSLLIHQYLDKGFGVVISANKWDSADSESFKRSFEVNLPVGSSLPCIKTSALNGTNLRSLMLAVKEVNKTLQKKIKTSEMNKWLGKVTDKFSPPRFKGRQIQLKYITQIHAYPPRFLVFVNSIPPHNYKKYLSNELRKNFDFIGCSVKILYERAKNPYAKLDK